MRSLSVKPVGKFCARRQPAWIDDDRNIVLRMDLNVERFHFARRSFRVVAV